jgi:hypothetical protein
MQPASANAGAGAITASGRGRATAAGTTAKKSSKHVPTYQDSTAGYIAVRKTDLREISKFGWLEEGIGAGGMFFLSGAFWAFFALVIEHHDHLADYWAGELLCLLSMIFGGVLVWLAHVHFAMRTDKIQAIFDEEKKN